MINFKNTRLVGHRGARSEVLENTLSGFQHAQRLQPRGLAGIEFDVQLTSDGHLVIFHDETLQRLCGLPSRIDQLNLIEIQRHLQSGHQIITLDKLSQALSASADRPSVLNSSASKLLSTAQKRAQNNLLGLPNFPSFTETTALKLPANTLTQFTHIELEIKTHNRTDYPKLIKALKRYLIDSPLAGLPIVLTSFDVQLLAQLQRDKLLTHIPRGLLARTPELLVTAPNTALQLGCTQLGIYYLLLSQSVIQHCHRYGLPVSAWTVNDIEVIKQLVKWQVDVIITDIPSQLL
ncbi:glycerophosphodiester phosphodiesterase [Psychrobacter sp. LV10R520-6]|uniref:glycerophosphodiester phosphodiesterase n=1 Tax=Psychrobacter sp. LV10R520-6 TaxID=1415574 RepID=UPI0024CDD935|nr:glycerophosphodiester phosphodiesterase [Psychrobacter sp. LV10R520-6]SNT70022.1 glycerophosphoryl diester phosphodiesterase [Psychrobacter sp. LV10R520-6]